MKVFRKWKRNVTDRDSWTIRRRYSEFRALRNKVGWLASSATVTKKYLFTYLFIYISLFLSQLQQDYTALLSVAFPKKKVFNRMKEQVIEERRWKLEW